jgi:hypothetical protein
MIGDDLNLLVPSRPRWQQQAAPKKLPVPPWTSDDESRLRQLILSGKSVPAISRIIDRTPLAIRKKASKLKLPLRRI